MGMEKKVLLSGPFLLAHPPPAPPHTHTLAHSPEWRRQMRLGGHQGYSLNGRTAPGDILGMQC